MNTEVIKQFLVGLGYSIDEASLSKFNRSVASATLKVTALAASIKLASAGIFYGISKIAESFEQMGYDLRLVSPAITKTLQLRQAMLAAYSKAGVNIKTAAEQSILFNFSLAKTKFALEALYRSVGLRFIPLLTKQMDIFRKNLYANMPKIQASLERFIKFIFQAFSAVVTLGARAWSMLGRIYDLFVSLDKATDGWSTKILAFIAVWRLLNLSFLATPLGAILTGLIALLALYDDYKTQQEGGESLFDWKKIQPYIDAAVRTFKVLFDVISSVAGAFGVLFDIAKKVLTLDFSKLVGPIQALGGSLASIGNKVGSLFGGIGAVAGGIGSAVGGFVSGAPALAAPIGPMNNPLGSQISNSQSNQKISQETNIVVQGSADANATGRAVASEQTRVNFDMARNMRGATR